MAKLYKKTVKSKKRIYLGRIDDDIYQRRVKDYHIYKYEDPIRDLECTGWTIDKDACEQHVFNGTKRILIKNTDSNLIYQTTTKNFMSNAIELSDRYLLGLDYWKVDNNDFAFKSVKVSKQSEKTDN